MVKGTPYYALKRYAKDFNGNEFYVTDANNNNKYLNIGIDGELHEIFAKTKENKIYYAKDYHGNFILPIRDKKPYYFFDNGPMFPVNDQNMLVYAKFNDCEIYPNAELTDFYLTDSTGNQCYARNSEGHFYYASKLHNGQLIQFYAKDNKGQNILIYDKNGAVIYLLNITLNQPIYQSTNNKEIYLNTNGTEIYGRNLQKLPVYAKNKGEEYFATNKDLIPYYAAYENIEFYPKLRNKKQVYLKIDKREIYASTETRKQYYAKNEQQDDILASNGNTTYYCRNVGKEIYPQTKNRDQFYKIENNIEIPAINKNNLEYYAQKNTGDLFYPIDFSEQD